MTAMVDNGFSVTQMKPSPNHFSRTFRSRATRFPTKYGRRKSFLNFKYSLPPYLPVS